jgi:Holliday junction resolvase
MASRNYEIGRRFEYRVQNWLRKEGYYVQRSYASKGLVDLIAVPKYVKVGWVNITLGIQAKKNGYVHPSEMKTLLECKNKWQMMIVIAWSDKKKKLRFRTLDDVEIPLDSLKNK